MKSLVAGSPWHEGTLERRNVVLLCREAVAPGRRWGATPRPAAWIKRRDGEDRGREREEPTGQREGARKTEDERERGTATALAGNARWWGGSAVEAQEGRQSQCTARECNAAPSNTEPTSECILPHFTTTPLSRIRAPCVSPLRFFLSFLLSSCSSVDPLPLLHLLARVGGLYLVTSSPRCGVLSASVLFFLGFLALPRSPLLSAFRSRRTSYSSTLIVLREKRRLYDLLVGVFSSGILTVISLNVGGVLRGHGDSSRTTRYC